jgi:hypothetical protein
MLYNCIILLPSLHLGYDVIDIATYVDSQTLSRLTAVLQGAKCTSESDLSKATYGL